MHQVSHITHPKKILRLRLWWVTNKKSPGKSKYFLESIENSRKSLLTGVLSDGSMGPRMASNVPKGSLAVYVGPEQRRFVIPMVCLSMPEFRALMDKVAEEYGFEQEGGLQIPCEVEDFEDMLLKCLAMKQVMCKNIRRL
ncbi:Auxin_inducible domain-containing protein [Cephalotus follicularis]|uniref:Auxin_inducible domain-containing protein n=1 Tax=Cephalotus follicularis TaxID=3775 RepID=A0A1Q3BV35_CEPFO|nr:Auxin_inducible domain-containing protein [Cephalotus follicularis]